MLTTENGIIKTEPMLSKRDLIAKLSKKSFNAFSNGPERATYMEIIDTIKRYEGAQGTVRRCDFTRFKPTGKYIKTNTSIQYQIVECEKCGQKTLQMTPFCPWCGCVADDSIKQVVINDNADKGKAHEWLLRPLTSEKLVQCIGEPLWFERFNGGDISVCSSEDGWYVPRYEDEDPLPQWKMEKYNVPDADGWRAWARKPRIKERAAAAWGEAKQE